MSLHTAAASSDSALLLGEGQPSAPPLPASTVAPRLTGSLGITVLAWAVRLVSLFDMLNALLRYQPKVIFWLGQWVPFEISEGHRLRMFLMSILLFVLASGLQRGKRRAWQITIAGLMLAPILHLGRDVVWPQALVNLVLIGFLVVHRRHFVVASDPRSTRSALIICPLLALGLVLFGTVRLHALHKHLLGDHSWPACLQTSVELVLVHHSGTMVPITHYSRDLFRILRTGGTMTALLGLILILRPVLLRRMYRFQNREKAGELISEFGDDSLDPYALLEDKSFFLTADARACVPYVLSGNLAVALADPIGPPAERVAAITEFAHFCRLRDWEPVFYEVTGELCPAYEQAGFCVFKIGEEGRLRGDNFHLRGRDFQNLRTARNLAHRARIRFRWYDSAEGIDLILERQLVEISRHWLTAKKAREMAFDMGAFSLEDIRKNGAAVALDETGHALAFATWRPFARGTGRALDLMRAGPKARNVMDFVLVESILRFHARGIDDISLGNAPLANVEAEPGLLQAEEKLVRLIYENLNQLYGYKSLFEFKRKYRPQWRGRYLAYHRGLHLPLVGLALARVHTSGGLWKFLART